jgi:hypothetical protein
MGRGLASGAGLKGFPGARFNILFLPSPFLFLDFCFVFLKEFFHSKMNEKEADHLWSFGSVFNS